jgi:Tetrapyrrole (Corrin/Porphyrin) Methylases
MKITEFLFNLAAEPRTLARFRREPDALMKEAGLSQYNQQLISEGDIRKLRSILFTETNSGDPEFEVAQSPPTMSPPPTISPAPDLTPTIEPPTNVEPFEEEPHEPPQFSHLEPPEENNPPIIEPEEEPEAEALAVSSRPSPLEIRDAGRVWDVGGLTVVGSGIRAGLQTTMEARVCIESASKVLYLLADPIAEEWVRKLNPNSESMDSFYQKGKRRMVAYEAMIEKILSCLEQAGDLCAVFYGHPGVFSYPARESIKRARLNGFNARMLPGISAEDNLIADLGIDPGPAGLQSFEVTTFLLYKYRFDTSVPLILWQVGVLGEVLWNPPHRAARDRLPILADYLIDHYGVNHEVVFYHASELPAGQPAIERLPLCDLREAKLATLSTLFVPPKGRAKFDAEMAKELNIQW